MRISNSNVKLFFYNLTTTPHNQK